MKRILTQLAILLTVVCASAGSAPHARTDTPKKQLIKPPGFNATMAPLSPAILVGDTLYLSGSVGSDPATGQLVKGGFEPELRQVMSNVQVLLKAAGMDLSDVVSVTAYLGDMSDFARFNEIYREYFKTQPLPTRSTVAVKELARGSRVELTMTAVRSR